MITVVNANALHIPLPDQSVQCVITSPPYWGLRDYGTAKWEGGSAECDHKVGGQVNMTKDKATNRDGIYDSGMRPGADASHCIKCSATRIDAQIGLESTPAAYVANIVDVMRECKRVLRDNGCLWLNLGDSFSGKQLTGIPWRVALALQDDGWYLRSDVIWSKPNPMPESVTDRPTKAHEYVFLLTKQARYYYDAEAIKEEQVKEAWSVSVRSFAYQNENSDPRGGGYRGDGGLMGRVNTGFRNRRSVWTVATSPYSGAHFATFPPALIEPMILAGTSARGECPHCGKAWVRVVEKSTIYPDRKSGRGENNDRNDGGMACNADRDVNTVGWSPTCACYAVPPLPDEPEDINGDMAAYKSEQRRILDLYATLPTVPQLVLDPFAGTATVGRVCAKHGRQFIGTELNLKYIDLADERTSSVQQAMGL